MLPVQRMNEDTYGNDQRINDTFPKMVDIVPIEAIYELSHFVSNSFLVSIQTTGKK